MNKILVPVDFSDTSMSALFYAIELFGRSALEITILHTYGIDSSAFHMKSMDRILEEDAQREMDALIKRVQEKEPEIVLKSKIMKGHAVSTITSLGNSGAYDFVVMGTKGASGLKEVFIGSVAGGVISKTSAPVVVVPANYVYRPIEEIVFAVGDNPISEEAVVEPLRKIAKMHRCKVNVLHIAEEKTPNVEKLQTHIEDLNPSVTYAFGTGNINQHLSDYLMKDDAGLLCLVRGNKGFLSRLLNESVTLKQTFSSPVPLLILHD